jgi:hypothetical protein
MIILWLLRIKSVLSTLLALIIDHWREFAIFAICMYALWNKTHYDSEKRAFEAYKAEITQQAKEQQIKNDILRKQSKIELADIIATHKESLRVANLDRVRETKNLKGSINEIRNELTIYRDATKLRNESSNSSGVPKVAEDTSGITEPERNCYGQLATVIDACKITDYDYKTLYKLYDKQCQLFGCE